MITLKQTGKFSVQRFALIQLYTLRSRACIHSAAISAAIFLVSLMTAINKSTGYWGYEHCMALNSLRNAITPVVVFSVLLSASQAFAGLGKKANCISEVMLPANASEKFLSRIIICIATGVVVALAMYLIAFGILAALSKSANEMAIPDAQIDCYWEMLLYRGYNPFCDTFGFHWDNWAGLIAGLSLFALGGTLWNEKALIIMPIISVFLIGVGNYLGIDGVVFGIVNIVISIACWWLAWRMYSRMQCSTIKVSMLWHLLKNKTLNKL